MRNALLSSTTTTLKRAWSIRSVGTAAVEHVRCTGEVVVGACRRPSIGLRLGPLWSDITRAPRQRCRRQREELRRLSVAFTGTVMVVPFVLVEGKTVVAAIFAVVEPASACSTAGALVLVSLRRRRILSNCSTRLAQPRVFQFTPCPLLNCGRTTH